MDGCIPCLVIFFHQTLYNIVAVMALTLIIMGTESECIATRMQTTGEINHEFLMQPISMNVIINSTVEFYCQIPSDTGMFPFFIVNGISVLQNAALFKERGIECKCSQSKNSPIVLRVQAFSINNNSIIQCLYVLDIETNLLCHSNPAVLLIQGRLGAPTNFKITMSSGTLILSWSPPENEDIINYSIYVTDVETRVLETITVTEGSEYEFLCPHDQDGVYQFRISAFNSIGEGKKSHAIIGTCLVMKSTSVPIITIESSEDGIATGSTSVPINETNTIEASEDGIAKGSSTNTPITVLTNTSKGITTIIIEAVSGSIIIIGVIVIAVIVCYCCYKDYCCNRRHEEADKNYRMKHNAAYEQTQPGVNMSISANAAYGVLLATNNRMPISVKAYATAEATIDDIQTTAEGTATQEADNEEQPTIDAYATTTATINEMTLYIEPYATVTVNSSTEMTRIEAVEM